MPQLDTLRHAMHGTPMDGKFICSRCGEVKEGKELIPGGTIGFYWVGHGDYWAKYAREGERLICDPCMFADEGYKSDYPLETQFSQVDA